MARTGSTIRQMACATLASAVSLAMFAVLLQTAAPEQYREERRISVSIALESERVTIESPQIIEPPSISHAHSLGEGDTGADGQDKSTIDVYVPAYRLTERPQVLIDIDPDWRFPGITLPVFSALLLINEYGDVDKVILEPQRLLPMVEEDIRSRFLIMRFVPGILHGRPVKSALRIEVRLE